MQQLTGAVHMHGLVPTRLWSSQLWGVTHFCSNLLSLLHHSSVVVNGKEMASGFIVLGCHLLLQQPLELLYGSSLVADGVLTVAHLPLHTTTRPVFPLDSPPLLHVLLFTPASLHVYQLYSDVLALVQLPLYHTTCTTRPAFTFDNVCCYMS